VCACLWQCKIWPNVIIDGKTEHYSDPAKISKLMFEKIQARKNNSNPNPKK
jgi:NADH:ubiquinone oxidoreductase subunit E